MVMHDDASADDVTKALTQKAGIRAVTTSRELRAGTDPSSIPPDDAVDAIVLERLGVIVVAPPEGGAAGLTALQAQLPGVLAMEPELYRWAIGDVDTGWLRGFRDGVNAVYDNLVGGQGPAATSAPPDSRFVDGPDRTWGLQAIGARSKDATGRGVRIAVLDTGIDANHPGFPQLAERRSFVRGEDPQDHNGHGTHCAGTICGSADDAPFLFSVAPDVELYVGKVLSNAGFGSDGDILAGIEWALDSGCRVISMSLGADVPTPSVAYERLARSALEDGALIVAAAGNNATRPLSRGFVGQPANCPSVLAVAAVDQTLSVAPFSAGGVAGQPASCPDVAGPGAQVFSSWPLPGRYRAISGTSMACPHAAAVAATWAEAAAVGGRPLWDRLVETTQPLAGDRGDVGRGLIRVP